MIFIDAPSIQKLLTQQQLIDVVRDAMKATSAGHVEQPLRQIYTMPDGKGVMGLMPGFMQQPHECFGTKVMSVFPDNFGTAFRSHQGAYLLFEPVHGSLVAVLDGGELTAIRTAAASAVATDVLASHDATHLAILGYGDQAEYHVNSISTVRAITTISVWGRSPEKAYRFVERMKKKLNVEFIICNSAQQAVKDAGIICTVTSSKDPFLKYDWIQPGCHVNAVGASVPTDQEVDLKTFCNSRLFVDYRPGIKKQTREYLEASNQGLIDETHFIGEVGEVLLNSVVGRQSAQQITLYRSLGIAAQDLATAWALFQKISSKEFVVSG